MHWGPNGPPSSSYWGTILAIGSDNGWWRAPSGNTGFRIGILSSEFGWVLNSVNLGKTEGAIARVVPSLS
jgi:hypothetical protein